MVAQKRALRASCDNCHQAKVKCVSTAAACQRCLSLNVPCIHSPPGRSGRVPAASGDRERGSNKNNNNNKAQNRTIHDSGVYGESKDDNIVLQVPLSQPPLAASAPSPSTPSATEFPTDSLALIDEPLDLILSSWLPINNPQSLHDDSGNTPTRRSSNPSTMTSAAEPISSSSSSSFFNQPTTPVIGMSLPISSAMADFATKELGLVQQQTPQASLNYGSKGAGLTCTCFQSILRALEKIQKADMHSLSLDFALGQNKEALIQICNSLKCTFPHDSTTRLLTMVLLRKNLHIYHLLYQLRFQNEAETSTSNAELFPPSSHSLSPFTFPSLQRQSFATGDNRQYDYNFPSEHLYQEKNTTQGVPGQGSTRLTLGAYQLDDADESSLKRQILLLDLNKVPTLLERLDRRACGLDETDGLDLYNMMRSALTAEFRAIVTAVEA
ncbi:hypothetical protein EIK77_007724 [Talaromyces pinophilus]|nr:hypothetical protein EIK77_007724 [Talaromyces pinophilus]PCG91810.1 Hypothetical protein PENO1_091900 [Penicillium occitanis (nom. inval.)]PCG92213.1 hypothetical protein PENOC_093640 [Penicillium occitanis (nom. inval.)]